MSASLLPRLIGIVVAVLVGVYYIGVVILGHGFGSDGYDVRVEVPRAGGIYTDGGVTYQGVEVGKVSSVTATADGVELVLHIDSDYEIPANSRADVRMLSALGEQYVDLVPTSAAGPPLVDGSVIDVSRTSVPVPVGKALASGQELLKSLDAEDLAAVEDLLAEAFGDVTPELKRLVETGQDLTDALIEAQPGTEKLIVDGRTVLEVGNATSEDLKAYVSALDRLSQRFADSDADIETLLADGGSALADIEDLVVDTSDPIEQFLSGAGAAGSAMADNQAALRALFAVIPAVSGRLADVAHDGSLRGVVMLNDGQPVCSYGGGTLPLPGADGAGGSPLSCPTGPGLQQRGPQRAPGGG